MSRPTFYLDEKPIRAGGVLLYRGDYSFLMIYSRGNYEDFGGRTDNIDTCIEDTVAREAEEESNGVLTREYVRMQLDNGKIFYNSPSKYIVYIAEITENFDPESFGDIEIHDNIKRTVEWIPLEKILDGEVSINPRIQTHQIKQYLETLCGDRPVFYLNDDSIRAGGVLLYRLDDKTNEYNFLMISCKEKYKDFGGKSSKMDGCIEDTVMRKAEEQSNGILTREYIGSQLSDAKIFYNKEIQYVVYITMIDDNFDPELFGDVQIHKNIQRTVEWVPLRRILDGALIARLQNIDIEDHLRKLHQLTQ